MTKIPKNQVQSYNFEFRADDTPSRNSVLFASQ